VASIEIAIPDSACEPGHSRRPSNEEIRVHRTGLSRMTAPGEASDGSSGSLTSRSWSLALQADKTPSTDSLNAVDRLLPRFSMLLRRTHQPESD
jgi:hypothetical protein